MFALILPYVFPQPGPTPQRDGPEPHRHGPPLLHVGGEQGHARPDGRRPGVPRLRQALRHHVHCEYHVIGT